MTEGIQRKRKVRYLWKIILFEKTVRTTYKRHTQYGGFLVAAFIGYILMMNQEAPMHRDFTLGQFFDIWGKNLSNDQIFNYVTNANNPLNVYINGTKVPDGTNYRDIKLHAHDEIAIVYGTPPSTIPSSYKFPEGL